MKKTLYIGLCIINILLVVDLIILIILRPIIPTSIIEFWVPPYYTESQNDIEYIFFADIISKLVVLTLLIIAIIRQKNNIFNFILLKVILIIYGAFLIYFFIFCDWLSFQLSHLIKFILVFISTLLLNNYFNDYKTASLNFFSSKRTLMFLSGIIFLPILIVIIINFSVRINNKQNTNAVIDYVIRNKCDSLAKKVIVNRICIITSRTHFFKESKEWKFSIFDKIFMYFQLNAYIPQKWENEIFHRVEFESFNDENSDINLHKLDSLSKTFNTDREYYISRPIFNFSGNIAFISISSLFIKEPTGRYAKYEDLFLEKHNNKWRIMNK